MADPRSRLLADLDANAALVAGLERDHARIVAAAEFANGDDEHDPEGATIAFERQQVIALLHQARRTRGDLEDALDRVGQGTYGVCVGCAGQIPAERLEARPSARTCVRC